jgi:PAS domain S-box-containing protein
MTKPLSAVLTRKYMLVLGLLLAVSMLAFLIFQQLLSSQITAQLVDESGRQRMLAHRIALYAELLTRDNSQTYRAALGDAIDDLEATHAYVQTRLHRTGFVGGLLTSAPDIDRHAGRLEVGVREFLADARQTLQLAGEGQTKREVVDRLLIKATATLPEEFEANMHHFQVLWQQREDWLQVFAVVGEGMTILLLVFSAFKIFRPLVTEVGSKIKQLEHLEAYYRSMMNNVGDGVVTFDSDLVVQYANNAFEAMTKRSTDQLVGRSLAEILPEVAALDGLFTTRTRRLEIVHSTGEGTALIFDVSLFVFEFEGHLQGIASFRDVTERKALEDRLRTFFYAIEHSPLSIVITNTSGVIEYANRRCSETSGFELDQIIGSTPRIFKSGQTGPDVYRAMWRSLLEGREWYGEMLNKRQNGELYWEFEAVSALKNDKGDITHFIAIKEDVTDQKRSAAALIDAKRQAEIANRAKSEFLANMSHELRTPLNAIIGFSEVMTMELFGPQGNPKYMEYSQAIQDSAKHLLSIINDVLDFSKLEAGRVSLYEETVKVSEVMAPVLLIAKERADARGIKLILGDSADGFNGLPYIHVDALRYKQVLLNIITNAVKFTPVGGTVRVDGRLLQDGGLDIIVRDTGIGMKEEDIPKALERFGQVDSALHRKYEGTGLGLPISKTLIELHGGALKLESKLNVGTTAVVHLPSSRVLFDPASGEMHEKKRPLMAE